MLVYTLITIAAIVALLVVIVALQPAGFRVSRATTIDAPPAQVFDQVNDFHRWEAWNPWGKIDPNMKQTYEGSPAGVGAIYRWVGNGNVGEGRMTIIESRPSDRIQIRLEFLKPFAGTNTAEFTFKPEGHQTTLTWSMAGNKNFMTKAIHLVVSMDKMIGSQFEKGLADIKAITEQTSKPVVAERGS